jgi:P-type Ca2+ transporter type 2B
MGIAGTKVAQEAAGIIILDDNFASIITSIKWGRNVFECIRKFLQFQLSVNFVAMFMAFLGGVILRESPLNAI